MDSSYALLLVFLLVDFCALEESPVNRFVDKPAPGKPQNVSKNDPDVKKAVLISTYFFNNQSNDAFLFKASGIENAQRQVVKGIKYVLEVKISRTVCRKNTTDVDLENCAFQSQHVLKQTLLCHFEVWAIPWQKLMKTTSSVCISEKKSKKASSH